MNHSRRQLSERIHLLICMLCDFILCSFCIGRLNYLLLLTLPLFFFGIFVTLLEKFLKTEIRCNTCETYRWGQRPQRNEGHKVRAVFGQDRHQHNKIHVKLKRRSGHKRREESTCSDGKEAMMMRGEDQ